MSRRQTRRTISLMAAMPPLIKEAALAKGVFASQYTHEALSARLLDDGYSPPTHVQSPKPIPQSERTRKRARRALGLGRRGRPGIPAETRLEIIRAASRPGPQPTCVALARAFDVSNQTVASVLRSAGIALLPPGRQPGSPNPRRNIERRDQARAMRAEGKTFKEIAIALGVSRARAQQLSVKTYAGESAP